MKQNYSALNQNSRCVQCLGCGLLESKAFKGKAECDNFKQGYTDQERADKLREENAYGSMYGNNN
jgi:hypothetical protein